MNTLKYIDILYKAMDGEVNRLAKEYNFNATDIKILITLYDNEENNLASDLVNSLSLAKSYISTSVNSLYNNGLIKKRQDTNDKKKIHLSLTEKGIDLINEITPRLLTLKDNLLYNISDSDIVVTRNTLKSIVNNAQNINNINEGKERHE